MFEELIARIEAHERYGPAVRQAAGGGGALVLNYHTHGRGQPYCVSICVRKDDPLRVLGQPEPLTELAHIRGIGREEGECAPLMTALGRSLKDHYGLTGFPAIFLNGRAFTG